MRFILKPRKLNYRKASRHVVFRYCESRMVHAYAKKYERNDILGVHSLNRYNQRGLKNAITKNIAIVVLLIYQINISHHHKHSTVHQSDHKHRILFSFEESFVKHSNQTPTLPETSKVVHLSFDKHLLCKTFLPNAASSQLHTLFHFFQPITLSTFADVLVPPPRVLSIFL